MYYDFSPILMRHAPRETVDAWMSRRTKLEPVKLIPALVQYNLSEDELKVGVIGCRQQWVGVVSDCRGVLITGSQQGSHTISGILC